MTQDNETFSHQYIAYCRKKILKEYFPKFQRCVNELSEEEIWWRANETDNSVGNILLHLCGNIRQWIISGIGGTADIRERAKEFSERTHIPKNELLHNLETTMQEADCVLQRVDSSTLWEMRRIQIYDVTVLELIAQVVEHLSYHLGQIVYITKMKKGIDLKFYML
ncbi:MAG: DUF1572 domain-containing protein [Ignavibacteria bacterium]|nr:DUF1572 domain-containing protein [Ignavibacteria bacterium]